jgi:hypothetical protein
VVRRRASDALLRMGGTMAFSRLPPEPIYGPVAGPAEHRRRVQQDADERAAQRGVELESQASPMKDAQERIVIWERLHALRLPRAAGHVLVKVIAKQTRLTVAEVREEQQRRAGPFVQSAPALVAPHLRMEDGAAAAHEGVTVDPTSK